MNRMLISRSGGIRDYLAVGNYRHSLVRDHRYVKTRLVDRLIERRKHASRVGVFELGRSVFSTLVVFADVKAAHLIVQNSGVQDVNTDWTSEKRIVDLKCRGFLGLVRGDLGTLGASTAGDLHLMKSNVGGVEHDLRRGLQQSNLYRFIPFEGIPHKIGTETKSISVRDCSLRKPLGHSRESQAQNKKQAFHS